MHKKFSYIRLYDNNNVVIVDTPIAIDNITITAITVNTNETMVINQEEEVIMVRSDLSVHGKFCD